MLSVAARDTLALVLTIGLGVMWLWAAVAKVRSPLPIENLKRLLPLPSPLLLVASRALPAVEITLGLLLLARIAMPITAYLSATLLLAFAAVQVVALVRASLATEAELQQTGHAVATCGCFGRRSSVSPDPITDVTRPQLPVSAPAHPELDTAALHVAGALLLSAVAVAVALP